MPCMSSCSNSHLNCGQHRQPLSDSILLAAGAMVVKTRQRLEGISDFYRLVDCIIVFFGLSAFSYLPSLQSVPV